MQDSARTVTAAVVRYRGPVGAGRRVTAERCGCRDHDGFVEHDQPAAAAAVTVADEARSALLEDLLEQAAGCFPRRETGSRAARWYAVC